MKFNIILLKGTDIITFGMTKEEIQSKLKSKPKLFNNSGSLIDTEDYGGNIHVYYNTIQRCEAIEIFSPTEVYLDDIEILGQSRKKIEVLFSKFDDFNKDVSTFGSKKNEIIVYSPEDAIESVFIAEKGYSERAEKLYKEFLSDMRKNRAKELPKTKDRSIIEIMHLFREKKIIARDIVINVNDQEAFAERYHKIMDNSIRSNSINALLMDFCETPEEKLNVKILSMLQYAYMEIVEKCNETILKGNVSEAKKYLAHEIKLLQKRYERVFDFFIRTDK